MSVRSLRNATAVLAVVLFAGVPGRAADGSWSSTAASGNWSTTTNWTGGIVADGANSTATFATPNLTVPVTVTLDTNRTIGNLVFDNPTNTFGWTLRSSGGSTLTL